MTIEPRPLIEKYLEEICHKEQVSILLAIESGSRAWGFPSPDSDYDVRFIYARKRDDYLAVFEQRDVIELPISGDMDINGWDLKKTLQLLFKQNTTVLEWCQSPIIYRQVEGFREDLLSFSDLIRKRVSFIHHYRALATRMYVDEVKGKELMKLKKYCYVLRPIMALRWFRVHPQLSRVPMTMSALLDESQTPCQIRSLIEELIEKKRTIDESGLSPRYPELDKFIEDEFELVEESLAQTEASAHGDVKELANTVFRRWLAP
jgi:uncharacterized protein